VRNIVSVLLAFVASLALLGVETALGGTFTSANIEGNYACQMQGGFSLQPFSHSIMQIHASGAGTIIVPNAAHPGLFETVIGAFGTDQMPNPTATPTPSSAFYFQEAFEICRYRLGTGSTYSVNKDGTGVLTINWTPESGNPSSFVNCTVAITTHYDILLNSSTSFTVLSTDLNTNSCNGTDFTSCGSSLSGTCTLQ
jgi:hypothetical protein